MKKHLYFIVAAALVIFSLTGCSSPEDSAPANVVEEGGLLGAQPAATEVHYGDIIYLKSGAWQNYMSARGAENRSSVMLAQNPQEWEEWKIVDPEEPDSRAAVKFNDEVLLYSVFWQNYASGRDKGNRSGVLLMQEPMEWERWKFIAPAQKDSEATINFNDNVLIHSVAWKNYLSARGAKDRSDVLLMTNPQEWEQWFIGPKGSSRNSYWMGDLASKLRNIPLTKAIIPGSHDSGTYSIADDAPFSPDLPIENEILKKLLLASAELSPEVSSYMARFARAQSSDMTEQLNAGIRYFDLRPGAADNGQGQELLVVHSLYGGDILDMIDATANFLDTHPQEIVILDFSHFTAMNDDHHQTLIKHIKEAFGTKLVPRPQSAEENNPQANAYTFSDLWENGWQVVCLYPDSNADAESLLWRYGTPQDNFWWPNKPTTDEVKAHLEDLLQNQRPQLADGSLFVLQTVLTGDEFLYAKVVARLEAEKLLDAAQSMLPPLQKKIDNLEIDLDNDENRINSCQNQINEYQAWINDHPWDVPGVVQRTYWIAELGDDLAAAYSVKLTTEGLLAAERTILDSANNTIANLHAQVAAALDVPTSLVDLAKAGNPAMLGWLDGWRKDLNIIILDAADPGFVDQVKALNSLNSIPVARTGPDQTVAMAAAATLDGSLSSDPNGDPLTFAWQFLSRPAGSAAVLSDPAAVTPTFHADVVGEYRIALTVSDGESVSEPAELLITFPNTPPLAAAGPDRQVPVLIPVQLDGSGSFDFEGPLSFTWTINSQPGPNAATLSGANTATPAFTPPDLGDYEIGLTVRDNLGAIAVDSLTVRVVLVVANAGADQRVSTFTEVYLDGSGSFDPKGTPLSYEWTMSFLPEWSIGAIDPMPVYSKAVLFQPTSATPHFIPDNPGRYLLQLTVRDSAGGSSSDSVVVTVDRW